MQDKSCSDAALAQMVTRGRTYSVWTAYSCTTLRQSLQYVRLMMSLLYDFERRAIVLEQADCLVLQLFRGKEDYVLIIYPDTTVSVALVDIRFNDFIIDLMQILGTGSHSSWELLGLPNHIMAALLVVYMEKDATARAKVSSSKTANLDIRIYVRAEFVQEALVTTTRDNHMTVGVRRVERALVNAFARVRWQLEHVRSLKLMDRLTITNRSHVKGDDHENLIDVTKYLAHAVMNTMKWTPPKAVQDSRTQISSRERHRLRPLSNEEESNA